MLLFSNAFLLSSFHSFNNKQHRARKNMIITGPKKNKIKEQSKKKSKEPKNVKKVTHASAWCSRTLFLIWRSNAMCSFHTSHPAFRRRGNVATTSLCTSQRRRRYVSNETPNDVSMERRQDVSVVRLYDVLLERHNDVSKGRNNDAPSLRLHDVSNKSQMKHPTTSQWYVSTTSH